VSIINRRAGREGGRDVVSFPETVRPCDLAIFGLKLPVLQGIAQGRFDGVFRLAISRRKLGLQFDNLRFKRRAFVNSHYLISFILVKGIDISVDFPRSEKKSRSEEAVAKK
jgi:hypothetical protein